LCGSGQDCRLLEDNDYNLGVVIAGRQFSSETSELLPYLALATLLSGKREDVLSFEFVDAHIAVCFHLFTKWFSIIWITSQFVFQ
jgi:hypothetical protein